MKLTTKQIERLVKQGEVVHTECKDASGGLPDSLWESYSAFANTDGGVILLGAKEVDGKFSITGVQNAAALIKRFWDCVNNREKVSVNILFDRHVYSVKCRGRDVVVIEVPRADRQDRPVYIGKDILSNPGVFRVNKAVAVEGGTSDARNSHIFNIFALVDIGERSGMGLADLYGHWKKHSLPEPVISEEYDPDRVKVTVYTDSGQSTANRPKSAPKVPQDPTKTRPRPDQDPTKTRLIAWSDLPSSCRRVYEALKQDAFLTYRGMVAKLGLNKDTINTAIGTLVQKGVIRREGNKQTGHWEVVK